MINPGVLRISQLLFQGGIIRGIHHSGGFRARFHGNVFYRFHKMFPLIRELIFAISEKGRISHGIQGGVPDQRIDAAKNIRLV